jgi:GNAT superfamily N-acetyltransferase
VCPILHKAMEKLALKFSFEKPHQIPSRILDQIQQLIEKGGGVGTTHVRENLHNAFLIGYVTHKGRVVGTVTHKHPKTEYRKRIEAATGLDLSGYLERGYTSVMPAYRQQDIADILIKGLIERSEGQKIYVTIRMDNTPGLKLTYKNSMTLAATFVNKKTGREIGVFTNQKDLSHGRDRLRTQKWENRVLLFEGYFS